MKIVYHMLGALLFVFVIGTLEVEAISCGDTISGTVTLTGNLVCSGYTGAKALSSGANNATLDCNDYTISGGAVSGRDGIYGSHAGFRVTNCNVANFRYGIWFHNCTNCVSDDNVSHGHLADGLYIDGNGSLGAKIAGGEYYNNGASGLYIHGTFGGISANPMYVNGVSAMGNASHGFNIDNASYTTLSALTASGNGGSGLYVNMSDYVVVSGYESEDDGTNALAIRSSGYGKYVGLNLTSRGVVIDKSTATNSVANLLDQVCVFSNGTTPTEAFTFTNIGSGGNSITNAAALLMVGNSSVKATSSSGNSVVDLFIDPSSLTTGLSASTFTVLSTQTGTLPELCDSDAPDDGLDGLDD
jgi:hypothetical protein